MTYCIHCGKELSFNDIGAHKKFINRGSREFMCISCLSAELKVPEKHIYEKSLDKLKLRCYNDLKLKKSCDEDGLKFKL